MSGSVTVRKGVNSGLKRLSGAKPCGFLGKVASMVAKGSLFLPFRASICKSCRQRTVARARFQRKNIKSWRMRSTKSAQDCSQSSISHKIAKTRGLKAILEDKVGKFHWFIDSLIHSLIHWFIHSFLHSFIPSFLHSCIPSFLHSFIRSFVHSFIRSFMCAFMHSFVRSFVHSFMHACIFSFIHASMHACIHSFVRSFMHSCVHSLLAFMATDFCSFLGHPMATAFGGQRLATDFSMQNDRNTAEMPPRNHRDPSETQPKYFRDPDTTEALYRATTKIPKHYRGAIETPPKPTRAPPRPPRCHRDTESVKIPYSIYFRIIMYLNLEIYGYGILIYRSAIFLNLCQVPLPINLWWFTCRKNNLHFFLSIYTYLWFIQRK